MDFAVLRLMISLNWSNLFDGEVSGFGAPEDLVNEIGTATIHLGQIFAIGEQTAGRDPFPRNKHARQPPFNCEVDDLLAALEGECVLKNNQRVRMRFVIFAMAVSMSCGERTSTGSSSTPSAAAAFCVSFQG